MILSGVEGSKNEDTWWRMLWHLICQIRYSPESILWAVDQAAFSTQPRCGRQPVCPVPVLHRRSVELERPLARQRLERQQPRGSARNFIHFSPIFSGEFCFVSCPLQPPSILPISFIFIESAIYFLLSSDLLSHSTMSSTFWVSIFLIASRTYGSFSSRERKLAVAVASSDSMKSVSGE